MAAANVICALPTNDLLLILWHPALGFEFGYTDLVFVRAGVGKFQNIEQLDNTEK
jgi:hypothetical protein